ncbi:putative ATP-dependent RNA helicase DDX28 [Lampetra planeri]
MFNLNRGWRALRSCRLGYGQHTNCSKATQKDSAEVPIICIPHKIQQRIENVQKLKTNRSLKVYTMRAGKMLIRARRPEYNQHSSITHSKFAFPRLASQGWKHNKSIGDFFIINRMQENPMEPIVEIEGDGKEIQTNANSFRSFRMSTEVMQALSSQGIQAPTPVQIQTIPLIVKGSHVLCAAATGSGKTLCYLLPIVEQLRDEEKKGGVTTQLRCPRSVIIVPSRELLDQVKAVAKSLTHHAPLRVEALGCGHSMSQVRQFLDSHLIDVLITTPGTLWRALKQDLLDFSALRHFVLDEVDTLLDDSFNSELQSIFTHINVRQKPDASAGLHPWDGTQLILIGATFPRGVDELLGQVMDTSSFRVVRSNFLHCVPPHVEQTFMRVNNDDKLATLIDLLKKRDGHSQSGVIVFCNKATTVNWIGYMLDANHVKHVRLQGTMPFEMRVDILKRFREKDAAVLVCTDIGSRGLDTVRVETVINYDFPTCLSDYLHRVGRVGRVGSLVRGSVVNIVTHPWDVELVQKIEIAVRRHTPLPGINANIKRKLKSRHDIHEEVQKEKGEEEEEEEESSEFMH